MKTNARRVTNEETRQIQLEMLDEIDAFCRQHGIRYSLAFGTLLGAVRHKGYIPWDDDVDIIMPLPDMLRFKKEFKSEKLKYCDLDTEPYYEFHFSRIVYLPTYSKRGLIAKSYGVCIDLYPVVGMPDGMEAITSFFDKEKPILDQRKKMIKWRRIAIKRIPIKSIPGFRRSVEKFTNDILYSFPYDNSIYKLHAGRMHLDNVFDFDVFDKLIDLNFEGHKYLGPSEYHRYLSHCYGDYMQLPPEDKRHPYHGFVYYWK